MPLQIAVDLMDLDNLENIILLAYQLFKNKTFLADGTLLQTGICVQQISPGKSFYIFLGISKASKKPGFTVSSRKCYQFKANFFLGHPANNFSIEFEPALLKQMSRSV